MVGGLASAIVVATLVLLAVDGHPFGLLAAAAGAVIPFPLRGIAYLLGIPRPAGSPAEHPAGSPAERPAGSPAEHPAGSPAEHPAGSSERPAESRPRVSLGRPTWSYAHPSERGSTTGDPIAAAALATADYFAVQYGPGVEAEVKFALYARKTQQRPEQYFNPASAWKPDCQHCYLGLDQLHPAEDPNSAARARSHCRHGPHQTPNIRGPCETVREITVPATVNEITNVVVTEIIHAADAPD